jgi:hypothetical protein
MSSNPEVGCGAMAVRHMVEQLLASASKNNLRRSFRGHLFGATR